MGWVTLTLRKTELKRVHADYQMEDLRISREKRQMARRYHAEQTGVRNQQNAELRELRTDYNEQRDSIYDKISEKRSADYTSPNTEGESGESTTTTTATNNSTQEDSTDVSDLQRQLDDLKEEYQENKNYTSTFYEDDLADLEEEANDRETELDQDQVEVEAQMEAVAQEMQAVSDAISTEIQNSTIKLS